MSSTPSSAQQVPFFWGGGFELRNSTIATTDIDFSGGYTATNLSDPVNPQDVANKHYVDKMLSSVGENISVIVQLTGVGMNNATVLPMIPVTGVSTLLAASQVVNGPVAHFQVFASTPKRGDVMKTGQSGGDGSKGGYVRLQLYKDSSDGTYHLFKTCDAVGDENTYDGNYRVVATINSPSEQ